MRQSVRVANQPNRSMPIPDPVLPAASPTTLRYIQSDCGEAIAVLHLLGQDWNDCFICVLKPNYCTWQ